MLAATTAQRKIFVKNLDYRVLNVENQLFYVNITVDLLYENRVQPTKKLWTHKNPRSARSSDRSGKLLEDRSTYKYPKYRLNEDPVIIMNHRSNMFDLTECSKSPNSNKTFLFQMIAGAQKWASESWRSISDAFFPQEEELTENIPIWHPSKLDKIVNFESVLQDMRQKSNENSHEN